MPGPAKPGQAGGLSEGEPFADMLAAMLNNGQGGGFLGARQSGSDETVAAPVSQLAEMFNEHGLFVGAVASGSLASAPAPATETDPSPGESGTGPDRPSGDRAPEDHVRHQLPPPAAEEGFATTPGLPATSGSAGSGAHFAAGGRAARPQPVSMMHGAEPVRTLAGPVRQPASFAPSEPAQGAAPAGARQQRAARLVQDFLHAAGSTAAQVTLQAVEGEVSLSARIERLSREERSRLRAGIIELLGRHGFAAGEIRLNGEAEGARRL
jgi:hypothetical protein